MCVCQLWKSVFGTNLASQWDGGCGGSRLSMARPPPGLYHCCFTAPYTEFTQCLATGTFRMAAGAQAEADDNARYRLQ